MCLFAQVVCLILLLVSLSHLECLIARFCPRCIYHRGELTEIVTFTFIYARKKDSMIYTQRHVIKVDGRCSYTLQLQLLLFNFYVVQIAL